MSVIYYLMLQVGGCVSQLYITLCYSWEAVSVIYYLMLRMRGYVSYILPYVTVGRLCQSVTCYLMLQVGGYMKQFKNLMFTTVRGAGHMVPTNKPIPALDMFSAFLHMQRLP